MEKDNARKQDFRIVCWSGGKDSTATIIRAHERGEKIDLIIMALLWFDKKRKIHAESKNHLKWVMDCAKPKFESWGYKVEFVTSDKDYLYWFYKIRKSSKKHPETIGKYYGFPIGGHCNMQGEKALPIQRYVRQLKKQYNVIEYCGICIDEPDRIERMDNRGQISILVEEQLTRSDTMKLCAEYGLLSPDYTRVRGRAGNCWFCPNQRVPELAELKKNEPELYAELAELAKEKEVVSRGFRYGVPFEEIDLQVDEYLKSPPPEQLSLFDSCKEWR